MARSIYATFATENDAERATGALLDHGVAAEDVSFVISDPLLHPTIFHPDSSGVVSHGVPAAPVDAAPPSTRPLPGTYVAPSQGISTNTAFPYEERVKTSMPVANTAAAGESISHPVAGTTYSPPAHSQPALGATVLAPDTPQEVVEHERRPHIIDMESDRPQAADGISTTTAGDAAKGAAGGAGIGIGLGVLLGIAAVMVPGVGLIAGTGALVAGLAAATGVAGGIAGGAYGYLADLGIPAHNARLLSDHLKSGGVVLHIEVSGDLMEDDIMRLLTKYGATSAQGF